MTVLVRSIIGNSFAVVQKSCIYIYEDRNTLTKITYCKKRIEGNTNVKGRFVSAL